MHPTVINAIKTKLNTTKFECTGSVGGGCISDGQIYKTDKGKVFVKSNSQSKAQCMFEGEMKSLQSILDTKTVKVPEPYLVVENPSGGAVIVMEYVDMKRLRKYSALLGEKLARLHLHNIIKKDRASERRVGENGVEYVSQFGFPVTTCCGYISQDNEWTSDWVEFYGRKLDGQVKLLQKEYGDRKLTDLWSQLQPKLPQFFAGLDVKPSLLHGDLWSGNIGENSEGPVVFDPASFYGHHEYEFGITCMFGGFGGDFFESYHKLIPKDKGWGTRNKLYQLFHNLNHWNHFGTGYRGGSLNLMQELL